MKIQNEQEILDLNTREQIISEIKSQENIDRKNKDLKKYEIYKDQTKKWVIESLVKELSLETVARMENRASNISITRKVVDKLARCYVGGVTRVVEDDNSQASIDELSKKLKMNSVLKKSDRYLQLFKNTMIQVLPEKCTKEDGKYKIKPKVFAPHLYDVVEDASNKEVPMIVILTDFTERNNGISSEIYNRESSAMTPNFHKGNRRDEKIADSPDDAGSDNREFIWWTKNFHFTTNAKGEILSDKSPEELKNPIEKIPFVNLAEDQDGEFWAQGGDDLIDASVLVNVLITDMLGIANVQGWGQLVISGKNLPKILQGGPHRAILLEHETGDPTPTLSYQTSNPPLDAWMRMIEQYVALLLSTNQLSPTNIATKLDASSFPSGIAMLIENSEATGDIEDRQQVFKDIEPELWDIVARWHKVLFDSGILSQELAEIPTPVDTDVQLKFNEVKPVITEDQKMAILKARKDLGIDSLVDLIRIDNPELSVEQAEEKAVKIITEQLKLDGMVEVEKKKMGISVEPAVAEMLPVEDETDPEDELEDDSEEQDANKRE